MSPSVPGGVTPRVYNTATRQVEPLALDPHRPVRMYTCGPTVYRPVHLGNLRSYLLADTLRRLLLSLGYPVRHVKNITDVGHMRQELLDRGEDKVIAEALRAGLSPGDIAVRYTEAFHRDEQRLNILPADVFPHATDHVPRMVEITRQLVEGGYAYERGGNVYFRVASFHSYGELGGAISREGLRQGVRAETDPLKDDARDFALWKAAEHGRAALVWPSPWGAGFPGWHIECTAMATEHLGDQLDIHTGGVDNIFPHHEDERAQSEAFTGARPFARVWLHGQHLLADGVKMAKSTGNAFTLDDLLALNFEPLAFRYLCLTAHYRARLNFTLSSLRAAQAGLRRLRARVARWGEPCAEDALSPAASACRDAFWRTAADDLALPRCLALTWSLARGRSAARLEQVRSLGRAGGPRPTADEEPSLGDAGGPRPSADGEPSLGRLRSPRLTTAEQALVDGGGSATLTAAEKAWLARDFDRLLGLDLGQPPARRPADPFRGAVSSPRAVPDQTGQPDACDVSLNLLVQPDEDLSAVGRCVRSCLERASGLQLEVVVVDATGSPAGHAELVRLAQDVQPSGPVRVVWLDHDAGAGAGRNAGLRASRGQVVALAEASIEFLGDALGPLVATLSADRSIGAAGPYGLVTADFRHFYEQLDDSPEPREVDAVQNYLLAFRRADLPRIGWLDEHFRFYRILDLDLSCAIRTRVGRVVALGHLPIVRHRHTVWEALSEGDREERSRKNFGRFLKRWVHHPELLRPAGARDARALEALDRDQVAVHG